MNEDIIIGNIYLIFFETANKIVKRDVWFLAQSQTETHITFH